MEIDGDAAEHIKNIIAAKMGVPDEITVSEIARNKILELVSASPLIPDEKTIEAIASWQWIEKQATENEKLQRTQKPKKGWGYVFMALSGLCIFLVSYNIYSYEEKIRAFNVYVNVFAFVMAFVFFILSNISFHPNHLERFLKPLKKWFWDDRVGG